MEFSAEKVNAMSMDTVRIKMLLKYLDDTLVNDSQLPNAIEFMVRKFDVTPEELFLVTGLALVEEEDKDTSRLEDPRKIFSFIELVIPDFTKQMGDALGLDFGTVLDKNQLVEVQKTALEKVLAMREKKGKDDLQQQLNKAIAQENFEEAKRLTDLINKKSK